MHFPRFLLALLTTLVMAGPVGASALCDDFYARLPNVSRALCESAQLQASVARSVKGRTIYTRDVAPGAARLRVLVVGAMHGDELSSASVALHWIRLAQDAPMQTHWRFIPVLNPDGLFSRPARRVNANGVDLNRNFPTPNWARESVLYWEKRVRKDPRRWPGKQALSEPESKFLFDEMQRFQPDLIVSIHAPYGVLDFDGPAPAPSRLGRLYLDQVGVFPGSLGNYAGVHRGMPVVTIELANAQRTPTDAETVRMWRDLQRWMDKTLQQTVAARAGGRTLR
ncbi:MAG: murein peptide amidase A [Gammaproteobacteria bacterium]|uniref:M14 family murein peptide amidase A n=1 Tax=Rhodoferax sp. TaxID=50421 RepID=UPI00182E1C1E|nr:M14 family murein peptide amidase A [Rhodoferax sp.]MBU3899369.1 murein peptide amidase A [Gammaproteobacteria bacterium]MBA3058391.1 murein peptide amidase A [Rhodoferax sp.]MBU3997599.1 murein peptide amidase A [Gammaproteobacteria bacterium]MBU4080624.1 murein peptide amidase A [Gammaproteobacteria bacterium]MBU4113595.1 murein peptide amidase A [Gammaproteobacteria bacterium]